MATASSPNTTLDRYVVIHVATTCDEHGVYVTKDSAEVIEIGWILLNAQTLEELHRDSVLVKPVNTPITPLCTSLTTLTWEQLRTAGSFRDAINKFDSFAQEHLLSNNLDFSFVTLDAWDLRVQLPREARDKAVVLPPYLQHSRAFDLRTEYQRWQIRHPESLPYAQPTLSNICAALEVEPIQNSAPIKHNLPFHLQALAPASPRRAMEEAITLARVLGGLVRKAQPAHEHPDVLTRPLDARADVRAFLNERSKVLHMSGLPHDTTQSELESWFTQFGGRPIAFWTLRTADQHKPTGTGFAVFSSHEEAAESLCMNGRALSEKAIEVSPSSSRVLDKATDILAPFPPSKNRPRPGDWTCPSCGFSNFQRRTACFRCSYPAVPGGPGGPGNESMGYNSYGFPPPSVMQQGGGHHMGGHGHGHGHGHGMGHRGMSNHNVSVPFRAGDWRCGMETCQYHNFAKNVNCLRCGANRASASLSQDTAFSSPIDTPHSSYGMGGGSVASTPGPSPFAQPGNGFSSGGGFAGHQFSGPQSTFALPSGLGAQTGPYPLNTHQLGHSAGPVSAGTFDSRAEAAFSSAQLGPQSAGANGNYPDDPFSFLSSGLGGLAINDDHRREKLNGSAPTRSPA